jgi:hypothetical protein
VVVWELASRELAVGDFKPLDWSSLPPPKTDRQKDPVPAATPEAGR